MRLKFGVTEKISALVILVMLFSTISLTTIGYFVNYSQVETAAGEELIGCANITSGLLTASEFEALADGTVENLTSIEDRISWIIDHKKIFKNASVMTVEGKLLAVDASLKKEGFKAGDSFPVDPVIMNRIVETKLPAYSEVYSYGDAERKTGYAPIFKDHDPSKEIIALMAVDFDSSIIGQRTWAMLSSTISFGAIFPILGALVAYVLTRRMVQPLREMNTNMQKVANGDLTSPDMKVTTSDEIGELISAFNAMTCNLRSIVTSVRNSSHDVATSSEEITALIDESQRLVSSNSEDATELSKQADRGNDAILESSKNLLQLTSLIQMAKDKALSAESNSRATLTTASAGKNNVDEVVERMRTIRERTKETETLITTLNTYSKEIGSITEMITEIANQTNLLALNAAIEAARAGEHGRGFAVVADEVRKLAEQSSNGASKVNELVTKVYSTTQEAVSAMTTSLSEVDRGVDSVALAGESLDQIVTAVKETVDLVNVISTLTNDEVASSDKVISLIDELGTVIESTATSSVELSAATVRLTSAFEDLLASSKQSSATATDLSEIVERFKV